MIPAAGSDESAEGIAKQIVTRLRKALRIVERNVLADYAKVQLEHGRLTIVNRAHVHRGMYHHFRDAAVAAFTAAEHPPGTPADADIREILAGFGVQFGQSQVGAWEAIATSAMDGPRWSSLTNGSQPTTMRRRIARDGKRDWRSWRPPPREESSMPEQSNTITITRPVSEVFAFLADAENDTQWRGGVIEMTRTGGRGVGTTYRHIDAGPGGRRIDADVEITEFVPDQRIAFRTTKGPVRPTGSYDLQAHDGGLW